MTITFPSDELASVLSHRAGLGKSGLGRGLSIHAIDEFSRTKHVMMAK